MFNQYAADPIFAAAVDALFESARPHVLRFADKHAMELEAWPHDLPIWMLRWEDNGVTTRVRYSCGVAGGTAPGATLLAQSLFSDYPPSSCSQPQENSSECASESAVGGPDCVEANLTFGQGAADDEMCILPGAYYEPNFGAPAGHECDLALLTPID